ncbi:MAG: BTAD domain-containing putative transcriptional regulator [Bacillota bacterium]
MEKQKNSYLKIFTFGKFQVIIEDEIISETRSNYYKLWKLLKYLITYKNINQDIEVILGNLWPDQNITNPRHTFSNLIYRLRSLLNNRKSEDFIKLSGGYYGFNFDADNYWLDTEEFLLLTETADEKFNKNMESSLDLYKKALDLYKGQYLAELAYEEWVYLPREYYHKIYINTVLKTLDILKQTQNFFQIKELCEEVFKHEFYEENIHYYYIEALIELNRRERARFHLNRITSLFEEELGIELSPYLTDLLNINLKKSSENHEGKNLSKLSFNVDDIEEQGVFLCDPKTFCNIYRLEKIKQERSKRQNIFCALCLTPESKCSVKNELNKEMKIIEIVLRKNLRKSDMVCRWSENKYFLLLPDIDFKDINKVLARIENDYKNSTKNKYLLNSQYRAL